MCPSQPSLFLPPAALPSAAHPSCLLPPSLPTQAIQYGLHEEAFEIYKKFNKKVEAIKVLLDNMQDVGRANEYASKVRGRCAALCPLCGSACRVGTGLLGWAPPGHGEY